MKKNYFFKYILAFIVMSFLMNDAFAQSVVNESVAKQIGANFIANKARKANVSLNLIYTDNGVDGQPNLYIYNVDGGGFVIVSASKNVKPVLAYSTEHRLHIF